MHAVQLPLWALLSFGFYAAACIGWSMLTFPACPEAAVELQRVRSCRARPALSATRALPRCSSSQRSHCASCSARVIRASGTARAHGRCVCARWLLTSSFCVCVAAAAGDCRGARRPYSKGRAKTRCCRKVARQAVTHARPCKRAPVTTRGRHTHRGSSGVATPASGRLFIAKSVHSVRHARSLFLVSAEQQAHAACELLTAGPGPAARASAAAPAAASSPAPPPPRYEKEQAGPSARCAGAQACNPRAERCVRTAKRTQQPAEAAPARQRRPRRPPPRRLLRRARPGAACAWATCRRRRTRCLCGAPRGTPRTACAQTTAPARVSATKRRWQPAERTLICGEHQLFALVRYNARPQPPSWKRRARVLSACSLRRRCFAAAVSSASAALVGVLSPHGAAQGDGRGPCQVHRQGRAREAQRRPRGCVPARQSERKRAPRPHSAARTAYAACAARCWRRASQAAICSDGVARACAVVASRGGSARAARGRKPSRLLSDALRCGCGLQ